MLLVPNPAAVIGLQAVPLFPWGKFGIHLSFFTALSILANFCCWPNRLSWSLIAFMAFYGILTESLQLLVSHRTSRVMDGIENLLGIALGSAIYWLAWRLRKKEPECILSEEEEMDLERLSHIGQKKV
jgi:glycopeptide antibiotics resistance protein